MIGQHHFVHCVPVRISPVAVWVAVHGWSSIRAGDEVSGARQEMTKVDVGLVPQGTSLRSLSSADTVVVMASCYSHYYIGARDKWTLVDQGGDLSNCS
jgi:hypothetical protein